MLFTTLHAKQKTAKMYDVPFQDQILWNNEMVEGHSMTQMSREAKITLTEYPS